MNKTTFVFLYVILFFFYFLPSNGQSIHEEKQPLIAVLKQIELQYGLSFSFADENLVDKQLVPPPIDLSVDELLSYLENNTDLTFEKLDDNTIVVRNLLPRKSFQTQFLDEVVITNYLTKGISTNNDGRVTVKPQ